MASPWLRYSIVPYRETQGVHSPLSLFFLISTLPESTAAPLALLLVKDALSTEPHRIRVQNRDVLISAVRMAMTERDTKRIEDCILLVSTESRREDSE